MEPTTTTDRQEGEGGGGIRLSRDCSLPPDLPPAAAIGRSGRDPDTSSLRSENSFQTCSSEPQLNLVPRQVEDNYDDRKAGRLVKQQQYSALTAVTNNGSALPKQNDKLQNKTVR